MEKLPRNSPKQRRVFVAISLFLALFCSGIAIWTHYQEKARRVAILAHADEFLEKWHLPSTSEVSKVHIVRREPKLKDRVSIVLEKSPGQTITLWHRPKPPHITYAQVTDMGLPKLARGLDERDAKRLLEMNLGPEEASRVTLKQEPVITADWLALSFGVDDGRTSWTVKFDVETGQLRQAVMSEKP